jgi:hypothetical protein
MCPPSISASSGATLDPVIAIFWIAFFALLLIGVCL